MQPIFLIMGTPACGKSTISRALAATFDLGIHIPVDDLRHMVVGGLSDMKFETRDAANASDLQIRLARESASEMARIYNTAGFAVAIDDFWFSDNPKSFMNLEFHGVPETHYQLGEYAHKILLLPSLEITLERLFKRNAPNDPFANFLEDVIRWNYPLIKAHPKIGWQVIDSSNLSVSQTVNKILEMTTIKP